MLFTSGGVSASLGQARSCSHSLCLVLLHSGFSLQHPEESSSSTLAAFPAAAARLVWPSRGMVHGQERSPWQALGNGAQEAGLLLLTHESENLIPL